MVISADHDHRIPSIQEIDAITEEKGSFDSLKDVPYYNYEKSVSNFKTLIMMIFMIYVTAMIIIILSLKIASYLICN